MSNRRTPKKTKLNGDYVSRLRTLRKRLNMTQRRFATEFYVSSGAVALWENGDRAIPGPVRKLIEIYEKLLSNRE